MRVLKWVLIFWATLAVLNVCFLVFQMMLSLMLGVILGLVFSVDPASNLARGLGITSTILSMLFALAAAVTAFRSLRRFAFDETSSDE